MGAPLGPSGLSVLGQTGTDTAPGRLGVPNAVDMSPGALLGQYTAPAAPGGPPPTEAPNLRAFNNGNFFPQNEKPAAPGQGTQVGVAPGQENADISGLDWMRQMHTLYRNGNLRGAALGQLPKEQLGEPLPGTAPRPEPIFRRASRRTSRILRHPRRRLRLRRHRVSRYRHLPHRLLHDTFGQRPVTPDAARLRFSVARPFLTGRARAKCQLDEFWQLSVNFLCIGNTLTADGRGYR